MSKDRDDTIQILFFDANTPGVGHMHKTWIAVAQDGTPLATLDAFFKQSKTRWNREFPARAVINTYCSVYPPATDLVVNQAVNDLRTKWGRRLFRSGTASPKGGPRLEALGVTIDPWILAVEEHNNMLKERYKKAKLENPDLEERFTGAPAIHPYTPASANEMREANIAQATILIRLHPSGYPPVESSTFGAPD